MIDYKEPGNPAPMEAALDKSDPRYVGAAGRYQDLVLDLHNYDKVLEPRYGLPEEPVMVTLERLEKNTRPVDKEPPVVVGAELAELMA